MIKQILLLLVILYVCVGTMHASNCIVDVNGEDVVFTAAIDDTHRIIYNFKRCMANKLYTFERVSIADGNSETVVNSATSDNIGPFEVKGGGWCGGNHLYNDGVTPTATTVAVAIYADGVKLHSGDNVNARELRIAVMNNISNPLSNEMVSGGLQFAELLCSETVTYTIMGNSMRVDVAHHYSNKEPVTITKYYGMQSMFINENRVLTPRGKYATWTPISDVDRFKKVDFPYFHHFIEASDKMYQASYLSSLGLGTHSEVDADDVVYIGNSWSKSYHKLMGNATRVSGDSDMWSGIYTWFVKPICDNENLFVYQGYADGKPAYYINNRKKGKYMIPLSETLDGMNYKINEESASVKVRKKKNNIYLCAKAEGNAIITFVNK